METTTFCGETFSVRRIGKLTENVDLWIVENLEWEHGADLAESAVDCANEQLALGFSTWMPRAYMYSDEAQGWLVKVHLEK